MALSSHWKLRVMSLTHRSFASQMGRESIRILAVMESLELAPTDGVFAPYQGESGLIQSVDFEDVDEGVSGFLEFQSDDRALSPWSFDITDNVTMTSLGDESVEVAADGVFRGPEDEAPGNFTLTTQGDGETTASFSSDVAVPEPTGLLGLGVVAGVMAGLRRWTKPEESG